VVEVYGWDFVFAIDCVRNRFESGKTGSSFPNFMCKSNIEIFHPKRWTAWQKSSSKMKTPFLQPHILLVSAHKIISFMINEQNASKIRTDKIGR